MHYSDSFSLLGFELSSQVFIWRKGKVWNQAFGRDGFSNSLVEMVAEEDGEWTLVSETVC